MIAVQIPVFRFRKVAGSPLRSPCRSRSPRRAAVVVETALCVALVLLPLTLGILQFGFLMATSNQVEQLARDGGRWAAVHAQDPKFDSADNVVGSYRNYLKTQTANMGFVKWADLTVAVTPAAGARVVGSALTVSVVYPMNKKIFIGTTFPGLTKWNGNYTAKSTFVMEEGL